jgi:hypothetical protein
VKLPLVIIAVFAIAGCGGCHGTAPKSTNATGKALERIDVHAADAIGFATNARPHADDIGKVYVDAVLSSVIPIRQDTKEAQQAEEKNQQVIAWYDKHAEDGWNAAKREHDHWLGGYTRDLLKWVIGITLGLWVITGLLGAFLPMAGLGGTIMRLLPFANPFALLRDKVILPARAKK